MPTSVSIIVPFYNEEDNVLAVIDEIRATNPDAEILAVNDGSTDQTAHHLINRSRDIRILTFSRNLGQSAALYAGLKAASGEICVMMDGDGQNDPADIPKLVAQVNEKNLVCGYRANRQDTVSKKIASRIANGIRSALLGDGVRDTGCTLKALRREHLRHLVPFNGLHRFIPALLKSAGLEIVEIPVNHRARRAGQSKYTIGGRAVRGVYDLIGVGWLLTRRISWPIGEEF